MKLRFGANNICGYTRCVITVSLRDMIDVDMVLFVPR